MPCTPAGLPLRSIPPVMATLHISFNPTLTTVATNVFLCYSEDLPLAMALLSALVVLIEGFLVSRCKSHFPLKVLRQNYDYLVICSFTNFPDLCLLGNFCIHQSPSILPQQGGIFWFKLFCNMDLWTDIHPQSGHP